MFSRTAVLAALALAGFASIEAFAPPVRVSCEFGPIRRRHPHGTRCNDVKIDEAHTPQKREECAISVARKTIRDMDGGREGGGANRTTPRTHLLRGRSPTALRLNYLNPGSRRFSNDAVSRV